MENIFNPLIGMISSALAPSNRTLVPFDNHTLTLSFSLSFSSSRSHSHGLKLVKKCEPFFLFPLLPGCKMRQRGRACETRGYTMEKSDMCSLITHLGKTNALSFVFTFLTLLSFFFSFLFEYTHSNTNTHTHTSF